MIIPWHDNVIDEIKYLTRIKLFDNNLVSLYKQNAQCI